MIKNLIKLIIIIFISIFVVYKFDSVNQTKDNILEKTKNLMDSISNEDYDKIKSYVRKEDGTELSNQEIFNFLLNTGLYRATLINDDEPSFTYSINTNIFNTNKGTILFNYNALNGDLITNELEYYNTGVNEYFITDNIKKNEKKIKRYPFAKYLVNGEEIGYNNDTEINDDELLIYKVIQDENGNFYIEIIEEAKGDIKIKSLQRLEDVLDKNVNEYKYEINKDCSVISIYYNSEEDFLYDKNNYAYLTSLLCSTTIQALNEKPNWHLVFNYYDYNTEKLLKTEIIR